MVQVEIEIQNAPRVVQVGIVIPSGPGMESKVGRMTESDLPNKSCLLYGLIHFGPGRTARELAEALHGDDGYQQHANAWCVHLVNLGLVVRTGAGGNADPFRYYTTLVEG